ncbi:MAG: VanW family protein [bacterium]|nr:VanW family protein [bacterium]
MSIWRVLLQDYKKHTVGVLVSILLVLVGWVYIESQYIGYFYPGVAIAGEPVGGKTYAEVFVDFKTRTEKLMTDGFRVVLTGEKGEKKVHIPFAISGLTADNLVEYFSLGAWEEVTEEAYKFGRSGPLLVQPLRKLSALLFGTNFELPTVTRKYALQSLLSRELSGFFKEAVPARFVYDGAFMAIAKEKNGESGGVDEIAEIINLRLAALDPSPILFSSVPVMPAVTAKQLEPFLKLANEVSNATSLVFYYRDSRWKVSGRTLATWLTVKKENEIGIDNVKLKNFLAKTVAPIIDNPPRNSRFEMRGGVLTEIIPGKPGNVVDIEKTIQQVESVVYTVQSSYATTANLLLALTSAGSQVDVKARTGVIEIPIEIIQANPQITKLVVDNYGIKDLVGSAKTSFKGSSSDRKHNIEVGVSKLNGILLAPGEEFSAVNGIGETNEEEGFVKEYVIKDNKSIKEFGGGLCQLATTLFRLALDTGLPVTERTNHRYVVGYYGPGLDATIYGPTPDLRFVNDTGNYLLLQGKVEGSELVFELYGQRDGRMVEISAPVLTDEIPAPSERYVPTADLKIGQMECTETPRKGVTADVAYDVRYLNGDTKNQIFHSVYQPWQKICLFGTTPI